MKKKTWKTSKGSNNLSAYRKKEKRKPGISPRVAPSKVTMLTQEEINYMAPTIPMETHNTATKIEEGPLTWYLINEVIDTDIWDILQYRYLIQSKEEKKKNSEKRTIRIIWTICRRISRKSKKGTNTICTVTYSRIIFTVQPQK